MFQKNDIFTMKTSSTISLFMMRYVTLFLVLCGLSMISHEGMIIVCSVSQCQNLCKRTRNFILGLLLTLD